MPHRFRGPVSSARVGDWRALARDGFDNAWPGRVRGRRVLLGAMTVACVRLRGDLKAYSPKTSGRVYAVILPGRLCRRRESATLCTARVSRS